jgi:hypothetical protein
VRTALAVVAGLVCGGILGYLVGAYLACMVFHIGNLCGLIGVFMTGPLGAVGGGVGGWYVACRR